MKTESKKTKPVSKKAFFKGSFVSIFVFLMMTVFVIIGLLAGALIGYIQTSDSITPDDLSIKGFTSNIYDHKQRLVSPLQGDKNREMVDYNATPKYLRNAFVAIEDRRFYDHPGIDIRRIGGAVINYIKPTGDIYGASTITQQVVKNLTDKTERTFKRKIQEQWKALELERHLKKDQILEIYMNIIYMGHNCYGVQSASKLYFGKDVSKLSLAESAALAGITNAPAVYDPMTKKGRENVKKRQEIILGEMLELQFIKADDYEKAMNEPLKYVEGNKNGHSNNAVQSYFVDQVVFDVKNALLARGYSEDLALKMIYNNGLKIYTTLDLDVQKSMDEVFSNEKQYFSAVQKNLKPQGAMVILDAKNSQIRAIYGGSGPKSGSTFNRATAKTMQRQPGSTFKPIAVYAPAIDQRLISPASVIDDVPVRLNGPAKPRYPTNYDNSYRGLVTIRRSIKESLNVVAAKVWTINPRFPELSFSYLNRSSIDRSDENYVSTSLGGLNQGLNPLQMAAAYIPFVNKGAYYEPVTFVKVEDAKGKVILENKVTPKFVYDDETAFIMTDLLSEVVKPGGTAAGFGQIQGGKMPTAGKTGTTSSNYDKWFVGYSPYYVGATWYGYDTQTSLTPVEYNRALTLWRDVMEKAHKNLQPIAFNKAPSSIVKKP